MNPWTSGSMTDDTARPTGAPSYEVGYGRPPKATRFKPGASGNPHGRPKGTKNFKTLFEEELHDKISIRDGKVTKSVSKQEAIIKTIMRDALKGEPKAITNLLTLIHRLNLAKSEDAATPDRDIASENVLATYLARLTPVGEPE